MESLEMTPFKGKNVLVTGGTGFVGSHFGAQALVTVAAINPYETLASNILGTVHVLEAARLSPRIKAVIVFTSDKAYGIHEEIPYKESFALHGKYPYDCSKSCEDLIAQMYYATYGVPLAIVRSGNIYGPGDLNYNRIIPGAIKALIDDDVLEIRSDGKMVREYVYVRDVAYACILLASNIDRAKGEAFNLGSKEVFSVLEILDRISAALKMPIKKKILNNAKAEIPMQSLDYSKIRKLVGWQPSISFEKAIQETYNWYAKR